MQPRATRTFRANLSCGKSGSGCRCYELTLRHKQAPNLDQRPVSLCLYDTGEHPITTIP